jgi:hypothetical protein
MYVDIYMPMLNSFIMEQNIPYPARDGADAPEHARCGTDDQQPLDVEPHHEERPGLDSLKWPWKILIQ